MTEDYYDKPHDSYVDITPVMQTPDGRVLRLGTVRYLVPHALSGGLRDNEYIITNYIALPGYPNGAWSPYIHFEARISWADKPQPTTLPSTKDTREVKLKIKRELPESRMDIVSGQE